MSDVAFGFAVFHVVGLWLFSAHRLMARRSGRFDSWVRSRGSKLLALAYLALWEVSLLVGLAVEYGCRVAVRKLQNMTPSLPCNGILIVSLENGGQYCRCNKFPREHMIYGVEDVSKPGVYSEPMKIYESGDCCPLKMDNPECERYLAGTIPGRLLKVFGRQEVSYFDSKAEDDYELLL